MATPTPFHFKTPHVPRSSWRLMVVAAATRSGRLSSTATPGGDGEDERRRVSAGHDGDDRGTTADHQSLRFVVPRSSSGCCS
ncbi:hypothetical protein Hanom_Chr06g00511371 [Helianthus anomalus]